MSWSGTESNFVQSDASQLHCKDTIYKGRFANKMPKKERKKERFHFSHFFSILGVTVVTVLQLKFCHLNSKKNFIIYYIYIYKYNKLLFDY